MSTTFFRERDCKWPCVCLPFQDAHWLAQTGEHTGLTEMGLHFQTRRSQKMAMV